MLKPDASLYDIALKIKLLRQNKGLSQRELAKLIGVDNSLISKYEKSAIVPSLPVLKKFVEIFDVSPSTLLGIDEKEYVDFESLVETYEKSVQADIDLSDLTKDDIRFIKSHIEFLRKKNIKQLNKK